MVEKQPLERELEDIYDDIEQALFKLNRANDELRKLEGELDSALVRYEETGGLKNRVSEDRIVNLLISIQEYLKLVDGSKEIDYLKEDIKRASKDLTDFFEHQREVARNEMDREYRKRRYR